MGLFSTQELGGIAKVLMDSYNDSSIGQWISAQREKENKERIELANYFVKLMNPYLTGNTTSRGMAQIAEMGINSGEGSFGTPMAMAQVGPLYHGSPYKFSKFADEKIGTGEGAQAFGYGHYLTDAKDIAGEYAYNRVGGKSWHLNVNGKPLSEHPVIQKTTDPTYTTATTAEAIKNALDKSGGDLFLAKKYLEKNSTYNMAHQRAFDIIRDVKNVKDIDFGTNLYTATVNKGKPSSADVFLEWDKPISKQPEFVINKMNEIADSLGSDGRYKLFGLSSDGRGAPNMGEVYKRISIELGGESKASEYLRSLGITGIKYPAGTLSGVKNSKATNYVIFDPDNITIDKVE